MVNVCCSMAKIIIAIVILLISITSFTEGSCWRYGHACWGGHGKRSGGTPTLKKAQEWSLRGTQPVMKPKLQENPNMGNDFAESRIKFNSAESNGNGGSGGKDAFYIIDYEQTEGLRENQSPEQYYDVQDAKRTDVENPEYEEEKVEEDIAASTQESLPQPQSQFSSFDSRVLNPHRANRILYKLNWLRKKNLGNANVSA